ncbi:MAG: ABC transporter ATP-binding protein, partial [Clostridiales bacterium]|nr:ABC transporter ATP-binding protein [Clostridiales bacterium]MDY5702699.1 ABC transporter ATP-binding protein [Eubacteriales bacterium]
MKKTKKQMPWREMLRLNNRALKLFYKRYPQMILSRLISVVWNSLTPYVSIYLSALVIDELAGSRNVERLQLLVLITLASAAVIALGTALLKKWTEAQSAGMWFKVENILSEKMLDMDYVSLDETHTAELLSTIRQNMNGGGWGLYRVVVAYEELCSSILTILGGISLTVSLFVSRVPDGAGALSALNNPLVVLAVITVMLAVTFIAPVLNNKSGSYYAKHADSHNLGNRLFSFFGWLGYYSELAPDVRIYRQDRICDRHNHNKDDTFCSNGLFARLAWGPIGLFAAAGSAVSVIFTGVVYAFVCLKALAGAFGLGSVTQYVASITKVSGGMSSFVSTLGDMRNNAPFLELTFEFLDIPNNMYQGSLTVEKRNDRKYEVEFRNVSFKYPGSENYALRNVNMKFEIGKRLAVVGMNGSGKTTFIKLLCRLYDPTEGEILLNGIDIRKYNYAEYMNIFSVVFQDFKLFSLTLGENVASGSNIDREKVIDCLNKAGFGGRLAEMPNGIDTYLYTDYEKDGVNVSGGEAQKIAIARALYKDSPFIILDEPTAALDPIAEAEIYGKFDEIAGDKTTIYISHRLSSCKFCDEIAVFH